MTNTDKIILVNPNDLDIYIFDYLNLERTNDYSSLLYGKTSLPSPILASAKQELIIFTNNLDEILIKNDLQNSINNLGINSNYLTIMASPNVIPHRKYLKDFSGLWEQLVFLIKSGELADYLGPEYPLYESLDQKFYSKLEDNHLSVGRIIGLSSSDVSSYISRILFYYPTSKKSTLAIYPLYGIFYTNFMAWSDKLRAEGFDIESVVVSYLEPAYGIDFLSENETRDLTKQVWKDKEGLAIMSHGLNDWTGIGSWEIPSLEDSLMLMLGCSTCAEPAGRSFCANSIRKGALAYFGNVGSSAGIVELSNIMNNIYSGEQDMGTAIKNSIISLEGDVWEDMTGMRNLIGDPTFKPILESKLTEENRLGKDDEYNCKANIKITKGPYPNPTTTQRVKEIGMTIEYDISYEDANKPCHAIFYVYDELGQTIYKDIAQDELSPGHYRFVWNGRSLVYGWDTSLVGFQDVGPGRYYFRISTGGSMSNTGEGTLIN
jgi:hypothetical protein